MAQFSPQPFGKYYLVDKLATGGMAEVYLARPPQGGTSGPRYLAIKRILPHFSNNAQFIDMFIDEAKISVQLEHENIVPVFDLGKIGETYFLAMEFVAGQDLKAIVTRCRDRGVRLSYEHAAWISSEMLKGLDYAHKKADRSGKSLGIVHRDISPQNILVGYDGGVKITDFGIAKAESKLDSTQVGTLKGKFGYMAPEQVVAGGPGLDQRADIFAAGIILWELVTGHRLFHGTSEIEILERVRAARFDPPSSFVPDVPRELERIIFKSLMKDRDKRYGSAFEMQVDLARFLASYAPQFNQGELAGVMEELFPDEIALAKSRWNVVIGPVIDQNKVEEGAINESTRPDQVRVSDFSGTPPPRPIPPVPASGAPSPPTITRATGKTPPPVQSSSPDARIVQARTQVSPPVAPPAAQALRPEDLFDEGGPFDSAEKERTISQSITAESERRVPPQIDAEERTATTQRRPSAPAPTPAPRPAPAVPKATPPPRGFAPPPPPPPAKVDPELLIPRGQSASRGRRSGSRLGVVIGVGTLLGLAVSSALAWIGAFPNPFAPPVIEVTSNVDATVSIDGTVVAAAGRSGRWRVHEGNRLVEVKKDGYDPFFRHVTAKRGDQLSVDAILQKSAGATAIGATTPAPAPTATPVGAKIRVETSPPGADVFVEGTLKGKTPLTVDGLEPSKSVIVTLVAPGFITENRTITPVVESATPVTVTLVADAKAAPTARKHGPGKGTTVGDGATSGDAEATSTPDVRVDPSKGFLSVDVPGGWGEVYVDGQQVAARTPVIRAPVASGSHTLRVYNPVLLKEKTVVITVEPGKPLEQKITLD